MEQTINLQSDELKNGINQMQETKEVLKRLFVGFSNKQKLENLRFFII